MGNRKSNSAPSMSVSQFVEGGYSPHDAVGLTGRRVQRCESYDDDTGIRPRRSRGGDPVPLRF